VTTITTTYNADGSKTEKTETLTTTPTGPWLPSNKSITDATGKFLRWECNGYCMDTKNRCDTGSYLPDLCPGAAANVMCCSKMHRTGGATTKASRTITIPAPKF